MTRATQPQAGSAALIIGCGFLGRALGRSLVAAGAIVYGATRRRQVADDLQTLGIRPLCLDVTDDRSLGAIQDVPAATSLDVYYLVPPAGHRAADSGYPPAASVAALVRALSPLQVRRAVLASSTRVYGDAGGPVSADSPPRPADARGEWLREMEERWLDGGLPARVVRFAGLYGPGRVIGLSALRGGQAIGGDPDALLNLIHVEDAAALLRTVAGSVAAARVELGADGRPVRRREYYGCLAARLGVALHWQSAVASAGTDGRRRTASRACDIGPTCDRTGWRPLWPDCRAALHELVAATAPAS